MRCYSCKIGEGEYFNRPEDGKKTSLGLCRDCYERRVREAGEFECERLSMRAENVRFRTEDTDESVRDIEREEEIASALSDLTEWR